MSLRADEVWYAHRGQDGWLLRGASVEVAPGEVVGLRGPSGVGKSTLARVLAGILRPARGSVSVDGTAYARPLRAVQYLAQDAQSAMDPRWKIGRVLAEAGEPADGEAVLVDEDWADRFPHELSGGQLQRVNLARALRARPGYLLADEITASLDAVNQARVWHDLLDVARSAGLGVLAVSHDAPLLARVADRVVDHGPGGPGA